MRRSLVPLSLFLWVAGCVTDGASPSSPPPLRIEAVQPGDQRLTCDDLRAQMAQMDGYIADGQKANADVQQRSVASTGTSEGVSLAGLSGMPFSGTILQAFNSPGIYDAQNRANRADEALERKRELARLYNQKNCP